MNREELLKRWLDEEECAHIHGWDFSHIDSRYECENDLPWDYRTAVLEFLHPEHRILDIDTGGGEFLRSLNHPYDRISATEAYPPNVQLCREVLLPLGIDFREARGDQTLPFPDGCFDRVLNRHGSYHPGEIHRVLKSGGIFITQQVGAENDRELVSLLLGDIPKPFPHQYLQIAAERFKQSGFSILRAEEAFRPIRFRDVGALVWFARIIEWEFPGFSVQKCQEKLLMAQKRLEEQDFLEGRIHRFLLIAQKN